MRPSGVRGASCFVAYLPCATDTPNRESDDWCNATAGFEHRGVIGVVLCADRPAMRRRGIDDGAAHVPEAG